MKTLKKLFSVSAIVALLGTLAPMYAFGANYSDELNEAYAYAYKNGITTMKTIDAADMYGSLTRVAMAKMIANYATTVLGLEPDTSAKCTFTDVTAALDAQYDNGVTKACQLGLMGQNITAFRPNDLVTRAEFGTTLSRALNAGKDELKDMNAADPYYKEHLNFLKSEGIMTKIDNPNMTEVRGYVMLMMMRADDSYTPAEGCTAEELLKCITADDYDACIAACTGPENPEEPTNPGYAKVTTKAAADQTVALNAVEKKIGTVTLTAGENDTTVTSIEITKSGLGLIDDIDTVQLMKNGKYVSNAAHFVASKKTATLRFSPKLIIKAGKSETFDVVVNLKGTTPNGKHDFSVTAVTVANGTFGGTPAKLGSLTTTNYEVGTVAVDLNGEQATAADAKTTPAYTVSAGDEDVEIASITLTPDTEAKITALTLTSNEDELDKAFSNVKAYVDDEVAGNVTVNDETISIEGLNETVKANKTLTIVLKGNITYVGETEYKTFYVESNHINATETNTNERMSYIANDPIDAYFGVKIAGVDLDIKNLVKKSTVKVAPGTDDVVLMDMEVSAGSDLEVTEYYVEFPAGFDFTEYEDDKVTLYVDGINYDITAVDTNDQYVISSKNDSFALPAGDKISVQLIADATDGAATDVAFEFGINVVKNVETNKTIGTTGTPLKYETSHTTTYEAGDITVKNTKKGSNNLMKEGATSEALFFSVKASNEKVTLKNLEVTIDVSAAADFDSIEKVELYKSGSNSALATIEGDDNTKFVVAGTTATLDFAINQPINADATENYVVKVKMDKGLVTALGERFDFALVDVEYRPASTPSADPNLNKSITTVAENYLLSSDKPTFGLTKDGNKINVALTNGSEYELDNVAFDIKVIGNFVDGADLLQLAIASNTWTLKDDSDHEIVGATAVYDPSTYLVTVTLPTTYTIDSANSSDPEILVIEMDEGTTILSNYYTVSEKVIHFKYTDGTDHSTTVDATY